MKKQKYDIDKIYQKLISDEIPQGYIDFIVSRCVTTCQQQVEQANDLATISVGAPTIKKAGFFGKR